MKKNLITVLALLLTTTLLLSVTNTTAQVEEAGEVVSIPDANLAASLRETLGLPPGAAITSDTMRNLTWLSAAGRGIADLTGLEYAVNLSGLNLAGDWIDNELYQNPISNLSPLASLTNLVGLYLGRTGVSDVSALANLTNLQDLELNSTGVSDVSALANLTNLVALNLWNTAVSDVSALANLTNLKTLYLENTGVSDVSALANLTNLTGLYLGRTDVSDVSALANLTNLEWLYLWDTAVSDVSALANLTNLKTLNIRNCPLNAAARQTHIPAIQANGTEVEFDPFKPIHLPRVPSLVSLIYFRPSDVPVRANVDAEIDALIKKAQRFFADEMERYGFGRKTFQFEADANGNAVVHHVNGKFTEAYYKQNRGWEKETKEQIYIPRQIITVYMLDGDVISRSNGGGSPYGGGGANIKHWGDEDFGWSWYSIAHELGHAFGMRYHDHRALSLMSYRGFDGSLSPCFAAWLDVHPAFNPTVVRRYTRATIQMLPATLAAPPNAIRLRFTVTAPAGSLYQARLLIREKTTHKGGHNSGGLIGCKRIDGNPTRSTVEFVTTVLAPDTEWVGLHIIRIDGDTVGSERFPIDVAFLADVNGDGVTDMADLAIVSQLVAQTMGTPVENPRADVNGDGVVDGEDFALVAGRLGEGEAAAPSQAALPAGLTLEKVEWALNLLHAENTGSPAFRRGIAKLEGFLALLVPDKTVLLANYPNPFNPETWIPYQLSEPAEVTVTIYAANGAVVRMLDLGHRRAGSYESRHRAAYWDGRNAAGESVASGVYFYTLSAGDFSATRKMVIRK